MQYADAHATRGSPYRLAIFRRTNVYSSASHAGNGSGERLNAATNGASGRVVQAGIRHLF